MSPVSRGLVCRRITGRLSYRLPLSSLKSDGMGIRELRQVFGLDPTKRKRPQILSILWQCIVLFGGPLLGIIFVDHYHFLMRDRTIYIGGVGSVCLFFLISFVQFRSDPNLRRFPLVFQIAFRLGWGFCSAALFWGFIGIANGLGTPLESRQVAVVAKHHTLQRDPTRRSYDLAVRPWPRLRTVVHLDGTRATYDRLPVPIEATDTSQDVLDSLPDRAEVTLIVGRGRLGLEWLKSIEPIPNALQ